MVHFDVRRAPAAGHFWSFAGLSPNVTWKKGQRRPYNAKLKSILAYRLGEVFVRFSGREQCLYGRLYAEKKAEIAAKNDAGEYAKYCKERLKQYDWKKGTPTRKALEAGRLPDGQVHQRARRYAVKIFLSHLWQVMYEDYYGRKAPNPYAIEHAGHVHLIEPPDWPGEHKGRNIRELLEGKDEIKQNGK